MYNKDERVRMFHRFIRDSLKHECLNFLRHRRYLSKHEICSSDLMKYEEGKEDEHAFLENHVRIIDVDIMIKNDLLYEALMEIEQRNRDILILSYGFRWSDRKIGEKLRLSRPTVQRLKKRYLRELKQALGVTENDQTELFDDDQDDRRENNSETEETDI